MSQPSGPGNDGTAVERARALLELARTRFRDGAPRASIETCLAAADLARAVGRWDLIGEAALVVGGIHDLETDAAVERLCREALAGLGDDREEARALRARLHGQLAVSLHHRFELEQAASHSALALSLAESSGDPDVLLSTLHARQMVVSGHDGAVETAELGTRIIELSERTGSVEAELWGRVWRIESLIQIGEAAACDREIESLSVLAHRSGMPLAHWHLRRARAGQLHRFGRFDEAERVAAEGEALFTVEQHPMSRTLYLSLLVVVGADRGRRPLIADEVAEAAAGAPPIVRCVLAHLHLALGDVEAARMEYDFIRPRIAELPLDSRWLGTASIAAELAAAFRDRETATLLHERLLPYRQMIVASTVAFFGPVTEFLGLLSLSLGRVDDAVAEFAAAAAQSAAGDMPPALVRAQLGQAEALVARSRPGDAATAGKLAGRAAEAARRLGMPTSAARADRLLARLAERGAGAKAERLTRREHEIAALVAEGRSNRAIADHLVLSERTIESHVQNILTKLNFHSRSQSAAWSVADARDRGEASGSGASADY